LVICRESLDTFCPWEETLHEVDDEDEVRVVNRRLQVLLIQGIAYKRMREAIDNYKKSMIYFK
jgi:hypothetical protein